MKSRPALLLLIAIACVVLFHASAFTPQTETEFWGRNDGGNLKIALTAQSPSEWWFKPWPHDAARCYRPVSATVYWLQWRAGAAFGYGAATVICSALFAVMCWATGLLALRFTGSQAAAAGVTVASAANNFTAPTVAGDMLSWWALTDNFLAISAWLLSLLAFDLWLEHRRRSHLAAAFTALLFAILSKETAYLAPLTWLALACYRVAPDRRALAAVAGACVTVAVVYALRTAFVPRPFDGDSIASIAKNNFGVQLAQTLARSPEMRNPTTLVWHVIDHGYAALCGLVQILITTGVCRAFWQHRRVSPNRACLWLAVIAILATPGFVPHGRYVFLAFSVMSIGIAGFVAVLPPFIQRSDFQVVVDGAGSLQVDKNERANLGGVEIIN